MPDQFLTFKHFHQEETANDLIQKLKELHIDFEVEDNDAFVNDALPGKIAHRDISIKLKPTDFQVAEIELENYYRFLTGQVDDRYHLFGFSNEELEDIVEKPDEWGDFDYQLAQKILADRGKDINPQFVADLQKKRYDNLAVPETYHKGWIYFGYISAIIGGLFGIITGWYLYHSRKTLPDGRKVYSYREWERKHGKQILILGGIFLPVWLMIKIKYGIGNY